MSLLVRLVVVATIVSIVCSAVPRQKHQETLQKTQDIPKVPNKRTIRLTTTKKTAIAKQNEQTYSKDSILTKKERPNSKARTLTQHKKAAIPRYPQQKKNKAELAARRKRSAQSNVRSVFKKKKTTVQEFPLNDLIYKGRASSEYKTCYWLEKNKQNE